MTATNPEHRNPTPWGRLAALAAACVVTLVGAVRGLDPEVVLLRAAGAAMVLGLLGFAVSTVAAAYLGGK